MRRVLIVLTMILCMLGVCGCTMGQIAETGNGTPEVVLSERQLQILELEGLPTVYEELSPAEQKAITAIEEMMTAMEQKYGVEFDYVGYYDGGMLDSEELTLCPSGGDPDTDAFSVEREEVDGAYVYTDGYGALLQKPGFTAFVEAYVRQELGEGNAVVYCIMFESEQSTCAYGDGDSVIFIDGGSVDADRFGAFAERFGSWQKESGITGSAQLILLQPDVLRYLTEYNYSDYLDEQYYAQRIFVNP